MSGPKTRVTDLAALEDVMVAATAPTARDNGDALQVNDKWLDVGTPAWNVWDGTDWQTMGSGGGGSVAVDANGTEVVAKASRLNFGTGLDVTDEGGGDVTIDLSATGDGAYAETIGDGSTASFAVTHNLGTEDVQVQVWDVSGTDPLLANDAPTSVEATDSNTVTVGFGAAPSTDQYRVVILRSGAAPSGVSGHRASLHTTASSGATLTLSLADGEFHDVTLDADCAIGFTGAAGGLAEYLDVLVRQDATVAREVTWDADISWEGGVAPSLTPTAGRADLFRFVTLDGGATFVGYRAAANLAAAAEPEIPTGGLVMWLDADALTYSDGDPVDAWDDRSGNDHDGTSTGSSRPTFKTGIANGKSVVRFAGSAASQVVNLPDNLFAAATEGEAFIVLRLDADPPATTENTGLWRIGTDTTSGHYPFTSGTIYDGFGSDTRKTTGDPTAALDQFHIYHVLSTSVEWTSWINEAQHFTTSSNTPAFRSTGLRIGQGGDSAWRLDGDVAEVIFYAAALSSTDRQAVADYLAEKYAITI